jgi:hypothetical protein
MRIYRINNWDHLLVCGQYEGVTLRNIVMLKWLFSFIRKFLLLFGMSSFR